MYPSVKKGQSYAIEVTGVGSFAALTVSIDHIQKRPTMAAVGHTSLHAATQRRRRNLRNGLRAGEEFGAKNGWLSSSKLLWLTCADIAMV